MQGRARLNFDAKARCITKGPRLKTLAAVGFTALIVVAAAWLLFGPQLSGPNRMSSVQTGTSHDASVLSDNLTVGFQSGLWGITIENTGSVGITEMTAILSTPVETKMCTGQGGLLTFLNCPATPISPYEHGTTVRSYASGAGPGSAVPGNSYKVTLVVTFEDSVLQNFTSFVTATAAQG